MFKNVTIKCEIPQKAINKMDYGFIETKYGQMVMGYTVENGILHIAYMHFSKGRPMVNFTNYLRKRWPDAEFCEDSAETQRSFDVNFQKQKQKREICVVLSGSPFQNKVWSALVNIPYGQERTYGEVASMIHQEGSRMAVARAVGKNDIAVFVPCHRVKSQTNDQSKYRWGSDLKTKIVTDEKHSA